MMQFQNENASELREYIAVIKARKWTIALTTVLGVALALTMSSRQTPLFVAQAKLQLNPNVDATYFTDAENESNTIASVAVASLVVEDLGLSVEPLDLLGGLSAEPESPTSESILITYTSADPLLARDVANYFADDYIGFREQQNRATQDAKRRVFEDRIAQERETFTRLTEKIALAQRQGQAGLSKIPALESRRAFVTSNIQILRQDLNDLATTFEAKVGEITRPATTPGSPSSPNHTSNAILGLLAGLILGTGIAFLQERLDDRFRGRPDVERSLEAPVLATVPKFQHKRGTELSISVDPSGIVSEAYRNLRTGVQFLASQRDIQSFLVTSPSAHEGKTSTVANLGIAISQVGLRVVLISGDLRRPQLEKYFHAESDVGLSTWLLGEEDQIEHIVLEHPDIPNLSLITSGRIPSNPAELLTSPRLPELVKTLEESFDIVLFDSPPVLPVADAVIIASHLRNAILIVDAASTGRSAAIHAKEQIERVGAQVLGCVLNAFDPTSTPYYYEPYRYSNYYASATDDSNHGHVEPDPRPLADSEQRPSVR
ncbi:MAG: tyrosine-protein kinase [Actinomycetota bacterium]|jgi:capsular exopolysaccharide synthesis family protein|nr:tyrosine-protein kinase [Actinomycetota bacterium]